MQQENVVFETATELVENTEVQPQTNGGTVAKVAGGIGLLALIGGVIVMIRRKTKDKRLARMANQLEKSGKYSVVKLADAPVEGTETLDEMLSSSEK